MSTKSVCLSTFTAYGCGLFLAPLMTTSHSLGVYIRWCFRAFSIVACIESTSIQLWPDSTLDRSSQVDQSVVRHEAMKLPQTGCDSDRHRCQKSSEV